MEVKISLTITFNFPTSPLPLSFYFQPQLGLPKRRPKNRIRRARDYDRDQWKKKLPGLKK